MVSGGSWPSARGALATSTVPGGSGTATGPKVVTDCQPPTGYDATWEWQENVSWIEVRLSPVDDGTRFELHHTALVGEQVNVHRAQGESATHHPHPRGDLFRLGAVNGGENPGAEIGKRRKARLPG